MTSPSMTSTETESTWSPSLWLVAAALLLVVGPLFGPVPRWLDERLSLPVAVVTLVGLFTITLGVLALALLQRRATQTSWAQAVADFGLAHAGARKALVAGAVLGVVWGLLGKFGVYQYLDEPDFGPTGLGVAAAVLGAIVGVAEDLVTRSFTMNALAQAGRSGRLQVVVSAVLFATYHSVWIGTVDAIGVFVFSTIYGLLLGGLYLWGGRSLWPVILGHSGALLIGEPQLTETLFLSLR